jgi:hypothetical protein
MKYRIQNVIFIEYQMSARSVTAGKFHKFIRFLSIFIALILITCLITYRCIARKNYYRKNITNSMSSPGKEHLTVLPDCDLCPKNVFLTFLAPELCKSYPPRQELTAVFGVDDFLPVICLSKEATFVLALFSYVAYFHRCRNYPQPRLKPRILFRSCDLSKISCFFQETSIPSFEL